MRRAPIVIAGTLVGLIGVLEFHTSAAKVSLAGGASLPNTPVASAGTGSGSTSSGSTSKSSSSKSTGAGSSTASRTAVGPAVNYSYGVLSVKVTVSGSKIVKVSIASLNDGGNPRSQYIDQQSIPILEQEVMQAQSANIQGVSGASYTSAGFAQSLQSALHSLGIS